MDVIALHQAGFDNAVASLGTALTEGHASLLSRYTKNVYLTYDSDGAGVNAAIRAIPILKKVGITTKIVNMRPMKDPDEFIKAYGADAYEERIRQAENSFLFEVRVASGRYDMSDPTEKSKFFHEVAEKLTLFEDVLERRIYAQEIARQFEVSEEDLMKMVNRIGARGGIVRQEEEQTSPQRTGKKEDGMKKSQKLLLSWLAENHKLYLLIKGKLTADDFSDPMCHKAAEMLFDQFEEGGAIVPSRIINAFEEEEEQAEIAGIFNAAIHQVENQSDMEKAIRETILRIKQNGIEARSKNMDPNDINGLMRVIEDKKALEQLERMQINLDSIS